MDGIQIKLDDVLNIFKRRWRIILGFPIILAALMGIISCFFITPQYTSSCKVFIGKDDSEKDNYDISDVQVYQKLLNTYSEFIKTNDLIINAIQEHDIKISVGQVLGGLNITPKNDTQIMTLSFKCSNPELSKNVLDAVTEEFIKESVTLIPDGHVKIIEKSQIPLRPTSPNKSKNIVLGFLIGIVFGTLIALVKEFMNDTFTSNKQIEEVLKLPVIGEILIEA